MEMANNIVLIVDDDKKITDLLKAYFTKENFTVITSYDGQDALMAVKTHNPDIVILDLMLPIIDGFEVLKRLRKDNNVPVIMLTARDEETDKLIGLEIGADDYISKPFSPREVVARAKVVLRRVQPLQDFSKELRVGEITVDLKKHEVRKNSRIVELTPLEFKIFELLCQNQGQVYSRLQIIEKIQGYEFDGYDRTVDAHIKNIRKKIEENPQKPEYLLTVFGIGYKLVCPDMELQ
jgi:two-component system, OmpR family, alkaline phosphatase synthesis response regulator PhoP